jgi:hypothetical protein
VPEKVISRNYFAKEKPVDRTGPVHRGPAAIAVLESSGSGHSGAQGRRGRGRGRAVARWLGDGGKRRRWSVLDEVGVADLGASKGGRG